MSKETRDFYAVEFEKGGFMPHENGRHLASEISGRAWRFDTERLLQSADKSVTSNRTLEDRLRSGCYYFAAGSFGNDLVAVFLWCPEIRERDVDTISQFMESFGGREMEAARGQKIIEAAYQRAYTGSEEVPLGTEWEKHE
jgi:hypothetical protein